MQAMFGCCFSVKQPKKEALPRTSVYYKSIKSRITQEEMWTLHLIYKDLAQRDKSHLVTHENFLHFFNLKGMWGVRLFRQFDEDQKQLISEEEFMFGISKTVRAKFDEKIMLLFKHFQDEQRGGITFRKLTKMLFHYSKDEVKMILLQDGVFVKENLINPANLQKIEEQISMIKENDSQKKIKQGQMSSHTILKSKSPKIVQLNYKCSTSTALTTFQQTYKNMINSYADPGTSLQINENNITYQLNYCNMISLIRAFCQHIFKKYGVDVKSGILDFNIFKEFIVQHNKLFRSYFAAFHEDLWGYQNSLPRFISLNKVEKRFEGRMPHQGQIRPIIGRLIDDALFISTPSGNKKEHQFMNPIKIICLLGLSVNGFCNKEGNGIVITHPSSSYSPCYIYFNNFEQYLNWIQFMKIYEGGSVVDKYQICESVGTGKFSVVYRCIHKQTRKQYALKLIDKNKLSEQALNAISNESRILQILKHPQIIKLHETIITKTQINMIMEYIDGQDLFQYVRKKKSLSEHQSAFIIGEIISAIIYLHSLEIVHRDLKPQNIMVMFKTTNSEKSSNMFIKNQVINMSKQQSQRASNNDSPVKEINTIKIIDFGLANHLSELQVLIKQKRMIGTPNYIAPEILFGEKVSLKCDNFAIGSIMFFLQILYNSRLRGRTAFQSHTNQEVLIKTVKGDYSMDDSKWNTISSEAKDLISLLLKRDPNERISLQQAINHPWFRKVSQVHKQGESNLQKISKQKLIK